VNSYFEQLEKQAKEWHKIYLDSFRIRIYKFEREYFVDKWHEHIAWDANPVETSRDCENAILSFRAHKAKRKNQKKKKGKKKK